MLCGCFFHTDPSSPGRLSHPGGQGLPRFSGMSSEHQLLALPWSLADWPGGQGEGRRPILTPRPPLPRVLPLLARAQQAARCGEPSTGPDTTGPGCGPQSVERPWPAHSPFWSSTAPSTQPKTRPSPLTSLRDVQRKHLLGAALLHWSLKQKSAATAELPRDPHQQRGPGLPVGFGCQPSSFWNLGQRQVGRGNSSEQAQRGRLPISLALLPRIRETSHRLQ